MPTDAKDAFLDPDVVPADGHRRAARVVLVDGDRVLLEHVAPGGDTWRGTWWELPGGGIEPGESTTTAAGRELAEETGYVDVDVGPIVATGRIRYRGEGAVVEQHESIHLARLRSDRRGEPRLAASEVRDQLDVRWVSVLELEDAGRLQPDGLLGLARDLVAGRLVPRRLRDQDVEAGPDTEVGLGALPDGSRPHVVDGRVVRDAAPWTEAVHAWLAHCLDVAIEAVPQPLGVDRFGREAVTFVPGAVTGETGDAIGPGDAGARSWPEPLRVVDGLAAVGGLLAALREAAASFEPAPDLVWRGGPTPLRDGEAICHGDVGHANLVWRQDGSPALIDWEFAHPGPPLRDLAEAACWLVPLVEFDHEARGFDHPPDRRARLAALARTGGTTVDGLLEAVGHYLDVEAARVMELGGLGIPPWDGFLEAGQPAGFERVRTYLAATPLA